MRIPILAAAALCASPLSRSGAQCSADVQRLTADLKFDRARAEVQAVLKKSPSDDAALHCMGWIYMAMNDPVSAADWFEKSVKANDTVSLHHLWLGNALGEQAQHINKLKLPFLARRVKSEFDSAVALDPTSIDARHGLIQFYSHAPGVMGGSMDKAKEQAREIAKLNAMRGHLEFAALAEREQDSLLADRELNAALAAAPDSAVAYNNLGAFYRRQKRYADAVTIYERLLKANPDAASAHLNIGWNLALSGQHVDRAEREVKQWLVAPPKDAPASSLSLAHYILGLVYERQAKKDAARAEYQTAVAINGRNEDAKRALGALGSP